MDTKMREERHAQMRAAAQNRPTQTIPVSPIFAPAQATVSSKSKRFDFLKKIEKKWYWIGGAIALIVLGLAVYFMFLNGGERATSNDFTSEPSLATNPDMPTIDPNLGFATQTPKESTDLITPIYVSPPEPNRWQQFIDWNRKNSEMTGPFLDKPSDWKDIFDRFPTRWFLWIVFLYPIWNLLKQDRLAAEDRTDIKAAKRGLVVLFVGVLFAGLLSAAATYLAVNIVGASIEIPKYLFISMGIVVNLFVQWTAAMNGRKDYSTFSIGGLFFTGVLIVWWFTPNLPMIVLGALFMAAGIWLQNVEMRRTHQGWAAHFTTLVMLVIFAGVTSLIYFLAGLIPVISPAMPWIQQFAYAAVYSGRLFIGAVLGLMVAFAGGNYVSTALMPPSIAGGVSLAGSRTDDDISHKFDVNSQYDAMAYSIMVLYPIAAALWYFVVLF